VRNLNPIACTLTHAQLGRRAARWKDALRRYACNTERLRDGLSIALGSDAPLDEFRELVSLESECCKWLNLDLREADGRAILTITADTDEGIAALQDMFASVKRRNGS
jgi:hypothetical protein